MKICPKCFRFRSDSVPIEPRESCKCGEAITEELCDEWDPKTQSTSSLPTKRGWYIYTTSNTSDMRVKIKSNIWVEAFYIFQDSEDRLVVFQTGKLLTHPYFQEGQWSSPSEEEKRDE